jgi:PBP1b-binding outer membrane lipoprotein LpoB
MDMLKVISSILLVSFFLNACASIQGVPLQHLSEAKPGDLFSVTPREAVSLLAKDDAIASSAYKGIESGEPKWLDLYKRVRPASDASVSESLDQSIGLAIIQSPSAAIDAIAEVKSGKIGQQAAFQYLNWPCGATSADFSEPEGNKDKERAAKDTASRELQAKIKALQSIKSVNLKTATECKEIAQQALTRWTSK